MSRITKNITQCSGACGGRCIHIFYMDMKRSPLSTTVPLLYRYTPAPNYHVIVQLLKIPRLERGGRHPKDPILDK